MRLDRCRAVRRSTLKTEWWDSPGGLGPPEELLDYLQKTSPLFSFHDGPPSMSGRGGVV